VNLVILPKARKAIEGLYDGALADFDDGR